MSSMITFNEIRSLFSLPSIPEKNKALPERVIQIFFTHLLSQKETRLRMTQRLIREARLANCALFRKFGTRLPCFQQLIPSLPKEIYPLIFQFLHLPKDQNNVALTCRNFKKWIENEQDKTFLKQHLSLEILDGNLEQYRSKTDMQNLVQHHYVAKRIQDTLLDRYHYLNAHNPERAQAWIGLLCKILEKYLPFRSQILLFQPIIFQWNAYRNSGNGRNPESFLNAIYCHPSCPKALQLYLATPTFLFPSQSLDTSFWKIRPLPLQEHPFIPKEMNEISKIVVTDEICQKLSIHSENKFQLDEAVVICYQESSISTPLLLFGQVVKIKKNGSYEVKVRLANQKGSIFIFEARQMGKIPFSALSKIF
jgi:hypothetical protein